jgi:predicted AAA+ superfamily ATPase
MPDSDPGRILETILPQNPWLEVARSRLPEVLAPAHERGLVEKLCGRLVDGSATPYSLLMGARRVGKTSIMYQVVSRLLASGVSPRRICWMRLDHPVLMRKPLGELVRGTGFLRKATADEPNYLFLDEVAWSGDWDRWLKTFSEEKWPIRLIATSSSTAINKDRPVESGVGHWQEFDVPPWMFSEHLAREGLGQPVAPGANLGEALEREIEDLHPMLGLDSTLRRYLVIGAFPEVLYGRSEGDDLADVLRSQDLLRRGAIEQAIYRDIPHAFGVQEPAHLEKLLCVLASLERGVLSPTRLASELGLTQPTIDKYIAYFRRAFLLFTLSNYSQLEESTLDLGDSTLEMLQEGGSVHRRGRKLYFADGGLRNAVLQTGVGLLRSDRELESLRENAVAAHLHALSRQDGGRLFHWRKGKVQVSFVYDHAEAPLAFEVAHTTMHDTTGLKEFQRQFPRFQNRCYLVSPNAVAQSAQDSPGGIGRIGLAPLLQIVGAQVEHAFSQRLAH